MFTKEFLDDCLSYDPESGVLTWKVRDQSTFIGEEGRRIQAAKVFNAKLAGKEINTSSTSYIAIGLNNKVYRAHQICWCIHHGYWPNRIDHIDGNGKNNSISNIREVTAKENSRNLKKNSNNTTGFCGVSPHKSSGKWQAYINGENGRVHLGIFPTPELAHAARLRAQRENQYHEGHGMR